MSSCTKLSGTDAPEEIPIFCFSSKNPSGISEISSIRRDGIFALSQRNLSFKELLEFFDPTMIRQSTSFTSSFTAS